MTSTPTSPSLAKSDLRKNLPVAPKHVRTCEKTPRLGGASLGDQSSASHGCAQPGTLIDSSKKWLGRSRCPPQGCTVDLLLPSCSRSLRHDLLPSPTRVLSDVGIGIVGHERKIGLAIGNSDLAKRRGGFLAQIRLLMGDALADRRQLAYWHVGNFVGGPEVFEGTVHQWSGVASSNCSVVHLPGKGLRTLAAEIPNLAIGLIEGLTFKGKCYSALAQMLGTRSITQRLAHLLLHLVELYGVEDGDGNVIAAAFTHADIAHMVGATRQWVTISLKRMQEKGIVLTRRSQIVVCRPDILEEMRGQASD
jgi:CRP/FNR family transcriptional regulator, cyclic AMP receptor protein